MAQQKNARIHSEKDKLEVKLEVRIRYWTEVYAFVPISDQYVNLSWFNITPTLLRVLLSSTDRFSGCYERKFAKVKKDQPSLSWPNLTYPNHPLLRSRCYLGPMHLANSRFPIILRWYYVNYYVIIIF